MFFIWKHTKDDYIAAVLGLITAIFVIPLLLNLGIRFQMLFLLLPIGMPVLWVFGMHVAAFFNRHVSFIGQFAKFLMVGFLNTAIDFGVLNLLSIFTGVTAGFVIGGINVFGFAVASVNSYFWNKFWVFQAGSNHYSDAALFVMVVAIGVILNSVIVVLMTTYMEPPATFSSQEWLNVGKVVATGVTLFWHFSAFKILVFSTAHTHDRA